MTAASAARHLLFFALPRLATQLSFDTHSHEYRTGPRDKEEQKGSNQFIRNGILILFPCWERGSVISDRQSLSHKTTAHTHSSGSIRSERIEQFHAIVADIVDLHDVEMREGVSRSLLSHPKVHL
jgi:hypothetical protein